MPDVDASLKEVEYALDVLHLDGVDIRTSYGRQYLGDPAFAPLYEELERRKAIVYSHPHEPDFAKGILPGVPGSTIEFCADTARAIASVHAEKFPRGVLYELKKFYYEVAQAAHPWALSSLTLLAPINHVLFGTDFPYRTSKEIGRQLEQFGFSAADLAAINRGNALRLFPRYK
jgi:predicted TIM-barrel fold metal-dependent hydrolase